MELVREWDLMWELVFGTIGRLFWCESLEHQVGGYKKFGIRVISEACESRGIDINS